jgi:hypothetical protein
MKAETLNGYVDNEDMKIKVVFDDRQGYIRFILNDYNKTEVKFDWIDIERILKGVVFNKR